MVEQHQSVDENKYRKATVSNIEWKEEQFIVRPTLGGRMAKGKTRKDSVNHHTICKLG